GRWGEGVIGGGARGAVQTLASEQKGGPGPVLVLATAGGRVLASDPASAFARDSLLPATALSASVRDGQTRLRGRPYVWAARPVEITDRAGTRVVGLAY